MTVEEESKRSADGPPADEPEAKAAKVEGDTSMKKEEDIKDEKKDDEVKLPIKDESDKKEKKEKKDKDKEKDKEKKEKKDKSEKKDKDKDKDKDAEKDRPPAPGVDSKDDPKALAVFDQRSRFKEGQKFLTPPVADATRAFYESLLMEHPESKIAIKFAVEYGLLDREKHNKILKKYLSMKDKGLYDQTKLMMAAKKDSSRKEKTDKEEKKEKKEKKEGKEGKEEKHSKEDKEKKEKKEKGSDKEKEKSEKKEKKEKAESKEKEPEMKAEVKTEEAQVAVAAA